MNFRDVKSAAIERTQNADCAYTKFITANDTGTTGGHQSGYHIHRDAWRLFFDAPGVKGENKEEFIKIGWQDELITDSRAIYYGVGTRNEYRLTRFGRRFPYLTDENVGNLLILCRMPDRQYEAFVLSADDDIDDFFAAFNISPADANGIIAKEVRLRRPEDAIADCFDTFLSSFKTEFPRTEYLAWQARECYRNSFRVANQAAIEDPDAELLKWLDAEYQLFKLIENNLYRRRISEPFGSVEEFVETANTLLNRRKSRAGKSLEHHLAEIFRIFGLDFDAQGQSEGAKRPDFIFPGSKEYRDLTFDKSQLIVLAAKTTCKDRWRQVTKEADRVSTKYLFTLQEGISKSQLQEMSTCDVRLVVPTSHLNSFPREFRSRILTLRDFIQLVRELKSSTNALRHG